MSITTADQYYLKALDNYPYELEEAIENVQYSLSSDQEHAGANCLMGQICIYYLDNANMAEYYFEQALVCEIEYKATYYHFSFMLIQQGKLEKAERLLQFALTIEGISVSLIYHRMAILLEKRKQFKLAKRFIKNAVSESVIDDEINFYNNELIRIKSKHKKKKQK